MNREQQTEWDVLKAKTDAVRRAYEKLDDAALTVRVCIDPEIDGYRVIAREKLTHRCNELIAAVHALSSHGKE